MSEDIIDRLRDLHALDHYDVLAAKEAAAEITRLRAENEELRETIKRQSSAARMGMDAAKKVSSEQLEQAARLRAESSPDALESERDMNAILSDEIERLRAEVEKMKEKLDAIKALPRCTTTTDKHGLTWVVEEFGEWLDADEVHQIMLFGPISGEEKR